MTRNRNNVAGAGIGFRQGAAGASQDNGVRPAGGNFGCAGAAHESVVRPGDLGADHTGAAVADGCPGANRSRPSINPKVRNKHLRDSRLQTRARNANK